MVQTWLLPEKRLETKVEENWIPNYKNLSDFKFNYTTQNREPSMVHTNKISFSTHLFIMNGNAGIKLFLNLLDSKLCVFAGATMPRSASIWYMHESVGQSEINTVKLSGILCGIK